ncbi:hypothetical protein NDU88_000467 [Pleurodeles waltl]|uniref:Uncharacterized protein n=1 Tax=Pleurodeles waltl TaxID=8319 RepID=A0AAV7KVQ3_PLEWA|nr:hypothetical protein NDU88_000467 [Pleurodeles waltl]
MPRLRVCGKCEKANNSGAGGGKTTREGGLLGSVGGWHLPSHPGRLEQPSTDRPLGAHRPKEDRDLRPFGTPTTSAPQKFSPLPSLAAGEEARTIKGV